MKELIEIQTVGGEICSVGIIGAGRGGGSMLSLFGVSSKCRVDYIVDVNSSAPALAAAKQKNIYTSTNILQSVRSRPVDLIIEATGSEKVLAEVKENMDENTLLLSSKVALLLFSIFDESRARINSEVFSEISTIRNSIVDETAKVKSSLSLITEISLNMRILSFNAGIEAAHSGVHGRGFSVIAREFGDISNRTHKLAEDVSVINDSIASLSGTIDLSLERFK